MPKRKIKLSAIIACYQDALAIPIMYRRLVKVFQQLKFNYEIIFVNDGSPDKSESVIAKLASQDQHVIGINHSRNFSSQMAFTSGMKIATGDAVILFDGDLQDPPELIPQLVAKWLTGFDVVYGIRVKREAPLLMQWGYKLFYRLFHQISYIKIPIDAGDFSLIDKKVVEALNLLPERDRFIRGLRAWVGYKQTGVPYIRPERMFGQTTNSLWKNFQWAIKGIFSFSYVPLQMITMISFLAFIFSLVLIVYQITVRLLWPSIAPKGITTVIVIVLFFGSVQLLSLSIIGEYIAKIFEEVKQRPPYVVKSIVRHSKTKKN
jgi:dolichol-phosphate mannosyltransferase